MNSAPRSYRMDTRTAAAEETARRILSATVELVWDAAGEQPTLDAVAARAGVTVQTVIRRFGDKESLLAQAARFETERIRRQRDSAPVGDTVGIVRVLVDHYEELGTKVLRLVCEESRNPGIKQIVDEGRAVHRSWCERAFAPALESRRGVERDRLLGQLIAVCDVQTWSLLRHTSCLSRRQTERALVELLDPLVEAAS